MTPVEAISTSSGAHPRALPTSSPVASAVCIPGSPVAALALPEFKITARALPVAARLRETCTGAAQKRLVVKVPAATQVSSAATRARSSRVGLRLNPAEMPVAAMPAAAQMPPGQAEKPYEAGSSLACGGTSG